MTGAPAARRTCRILAIGALTIGATVLLGWATGNRTLTSVLPGYVTMKANTAAALCLLAVATLLLSLPQPARAAAAAARRSAMWFASAASVLVGLLGALTLGEYISGVNLGLDELLARDPDASGPFPPGRLAPVTAVLLMLLASAQLLLIARKPRLIGITQGLAVVCCLAAFQALVGYACGVTYSFGSAFYTQMAIQTALGFVLLSASILFLAADHGFMKVVLGQTESARMMRIVLVAAVIVPPLVNWVAHAGEQEGLYDADVGVLLRVMANVVFVGLVVWDKGATLHAADLRRQAVEADARLVNEIQFKDKFLSHVSHELRSPLTAIKQFTTILLGGLGGDLNQEQREYQQIVLKNVLQLQAMIDVLLEVTRLEAGKLTVELERASVPEAVADALNTLHGRAEAKSVTMTVALAPALPPAYADGSRLRQILINLLDNAIKFTAEGGTVTVRALQPPSGALFLAIEVSDTGCGISPEIAGRIFERLYQVEGAAESSRKGLGLGLYICKDLVTRQCGTIQLESTPGVGSTFSFTVPVFCLANVIAPLFKDRKWPADSVALVTVETRFPAGLPRLELRDEHSQHVRSVLRQCLFADEDVLLPRMGRAGEDERAVVAAFANDMGAAVLAGRVRRQLERDRRPTDVVTDVSVSYRMLESAPVDPTASSEAVVAGMAAMFESEMDADGLARTAQS